MGYPNLRDLFTNDVEYELELDRADRVATIAYIGLCVGLVWYILHVMIIP